jgi:ubiquinone biosynthesis protein COQ4
MALADNAASGRAGRPGALQVHPLRALRALRRLLADKEDTGQVFEIMRALNGKASARGYRRLLRTTEGGRIAYERIEVGRLLLDAAYLDGLPAGSVGAAYRDFVRNRQLSSEGLARLSRQSLTHIEELHPYAWFGRRTRDSHDLWHVIAGYDTDALGEACLVAFSYAQTRALGWAVIALGAAHRFRREPAPFARAIWEGYRRGRRASWLLGEDYERLLREPLESARARLGIAPARAYDSIPPALRNPGGNPAKGQPSSPTR